MEHKACKRRREGREKVPITKLMHINKEAMSILTEGTWLIIKMMRIFKQSISLPMRTNLPNIKK